MATVGYGGGERPRYSALRRRIDAYYAALLPPLEALRKATFQALTLPDPSKDAADQGAFVYPGVTRRIIDDAVTQFLAEMAGRDRSRAGFSVPPDHLATTDGIIQQQDRLAFVTGVTRGADLLDAEPTLAAARESTAVREMLDNAFERLSENGALRLEGIRDEIHGVLASAQAAGLNPLETARQLGNQFDAYQGWEFQRLARTEAAFASEQGARDQMADLGVEQVQILVSADACDICQPYDGQTFAIDDDDNLPPYHPNCLCSVSPVTPDAPAAPDDAASEEPGP